MAIDPRAAAAPAAPPKRRRSLPWTPALSTVYTNFCRVNVTPEELVLDFGLNPLMQPTQGADPVKLTHRVVMSFYTANA